MKLPNPFRYRRLLAARVERAKRNRLREIRHDIATCEVMLDKLADLRDKATGDERYELTRERLRWMALEAQLNVALVLS